MEGMPKVKQSSGRITLDEFVADVVKTPGIGECLRLCDVAELEHVCDELIPNAFAAGYAGEHEAVKDYGLHLSLRRHLLAPVSRFVDELEKWQGDHAKKRAAIYSKRLGKTVYMGDSVRMEMEPSIEFLAGIERAANHIEFGPWSEVDGRACADRLRFSWYKWIAYLSSYYMWSKVPRILAAPALSRRNGRQPSRDGMPGRARRFDHEAICKKWDELVGSKGSGTASIVAGLFGCTPKTVRQIAKNRIGKKSEPNPAG